MILPKTERLSSIILDAPRSPSSLIFAHSARSLDVEGANKARRPFRRVVARVRARRRPVCHHRRCVHRMAGRSSASISEKSPDQVLPLLPIEAADFSQSLGWGTAITAVRFLLALLAVGCTAGFWISQNPLLIPISASPKPNPIAGRSSPPSRRPLKKLGPICLPGGDTRPESIVADRGQWVLTPDVGTT